MQVSRSEADRSNLAARRLWDRTAVGSQRSRAPRGSKNYFDDVRSYRYGYETPFIPRMFDFAGLAGKRVLEIGVGNGIDAVEMAHHGAIYSGLDISRNHIELTRKNFACHPETNYEKLYQGDLLDVRIDGQFDVVYSFGVLHHISHESLYLNKIRRLLKPNGTLRIAVYSRFSLFNLYLALTWLFRNRLRNPLEEWKSHVSEGSGLDRPVTIKIRSRNQVQRLLEDAGFRVCQYRKRGFVQRYVPILGSWLQPDGILLNKLGSILGWYHIFICTPLYQDQPREGLSQE